MSYDPNKPSEYDGIFRQASDETGVPYEYLRKLGFNESSFNPKAQSKTGPRGMMQFTKRTAINLGLNATDGDDDERLDPVKAVPAAARHLKELADKYDGDWLKASLAYNQGEGPGGRPQLEAYDKGDFSAISEEGRTYMRKLMDVAESPKKSDFEAFGGITETGKGLSSDQVFGDLGNAQATIGKGYVKQESVNVAGVEQPAPQVPYAKSYWDQYGERIGEVEEGGAFRKTKESVVSNIHNSTIGQVGMHMFDGNYDMVSSFLTPEAMKMYRPTREQLEQIAAKVPAEYMQAAIDRLGDNQDVELAIKSTLENYQKDAEAAGAGWAAQVTGGIAGAAFDPLTYTPMAGAAKGAKLLNKALVVGSQSAGLGMLSEGLRTNISGGEADYAGSALGGFIFGAGMSAVADGLSASLKGFRPDASPVNEFYGPNARLEARETARNAGSQDMSRIGTDQMDGLQWQTARDGSEFALHPLEDGAIILRDGTIVSDSNPINSKLVDDFVALNEPERAAKGLKLGDYSEIGLTVLRSKDKDVLTIGSDLLRSPTGGETGSKGKYGATASDIHQRLRQTDTRVYNELDDALTNARKKAPQTFQGMSKEAALLDIQKRAALAVEKPELYAKLTPEEKAVADIFKNHLGTKEDMLMNPAMFGDIRAKSILTSTRHSGKYIPNVYDDTIVSGFRAKYGREGLQEGIARSWLAAAKSRPEVMTRAKEFIMEANKLKSVNDVTDEMVEKLARDKAYGISHSDDFAASHMVDDTFAGEGLQGIENNNFLEARNPFDSDLPIKMPDGMEFSVNDLRDFDMTRVLPAYDRRVNGDIAIMGGSGKTTAELKDEIAKLKKKAQSSQNGQLKAEVAALQDTVKLLTGRARRDPDGIFGTMLRSMSDLGFFAKNAYMGVMNLTETAGMIAKGNLRATLHGIPVVRDLAFRTKAVSGGELRDIHAALFGKELDNLIRPRRQDIVDALRRNTNSSDWLTATVGTIKYGTQELSARSPLTRLIHGTSNYILDAARQGMMGDIAHAALTGSRSKWGQKGFLKSASITDEQYARVQALFKDHAKKGPNGQYVIHDKAAFTADPRAMDLWRMADQLADETILRPHTVSNSVTKQHGAAVAMAMQFKNFTLRSINGRFVRSLMMASKNHRAVDQALTTVISLGLSAGYYVMQAHAKAASLPEGQRDSYLQRALTDNMIMYASISRASHGVSGPLGLVNLAGGLVGQDWAKMVRSSVLPKETPERDPNKPMTSRELLGAFGGNVMEQVPGAGYVANAAAAGYNAAGLLTAPDLPTELDYRTGVYNSMKELVPNDPLTQQILLQIFNAEGIHLKERPKPQ